MAMRRRFSGIATYGLNGLGKGDEHLAYAPLEYCCIFTFYINLTYILMSISAAAENYNLRLCKHAAKLLSCGLTMHLLINENDQVKVS